MIDTALAHTTTVVALPGILDPINVLSWFGAWAFWGLLLVVFIESGVLFPVLPGDSLLFVAGAVAAVGGMNIVILLALLVVAAASGNMLNYHIGRYIGPRVFKWENSLFFNTAALQKTEAFYEKHGGKTLVISRFLPLFRTFAPFVAGVGKMDYLRFCLFNLIGAGLWVISLLLAGYFFGNLPWVKQNLSFVIVGIVVVSLLPAFVGWLRHRKE